MYCASCGKQIPDGAAFCGHCGKPVPQDNAFAKLVAAARTGDQDAVSTLYEKTYSKVYYTVKSMIKDEDAVFDIVQDTYLKAFAHLDTFRGDTKFLPWVRQIAANTARDWLKKKRPMLFAEMASDDGQDTPVEELLPDTRGGDIPDRVMDQKETKRLIREIIEELPEDQRAAIGMFYYEEMSVKQIAAAMGVSESAVKSRLMYARDKIEKKVRELEKKGTKLYNLAPLPFLLLLFRSLKAYAAEAPNAQILQVVLAAQPVGAAAAAGAAAGAASGAAQGAAGAGVAGVGAVEAGVVGVGAVEAGVVGVGAVEAGAVGAGAAGAGAGGAAAAAGALGALKIGIAAVAAAAVIGLGVYGAVQLASASDAPPELPAREDVFDRDESERPKRHEEAEDADEPEEPAPVDEALEQYRSIIGQADSYEYGKDLVPTDYQYALVQMRPDDPVPTLLLRVNTEDFISYVRFFQYDPDTKAVHQPAETVIGGVAGVGGYRGSLAMAGDGVGMLSTVWSSGTGATTITRITLDGDSLSEEVYWTGRFDLMPDSITRIGIEWHEIGDLSALDDWKALESDEDAQSGAGGGSALPTDGDRIVLTGTVGIYDFDGIIELCGDFGFINPYYEQSYFDSFRNDTGYGSETYRVIVLDAPQTLTLVVADLESEERPVDRYSSREFFMINVSGLDDMDRYGGRHITFSIDPANTFWPSDTLLPVGQPLTNNIHILE